MNSEKKYRIPGYVLLFAACILPLTLRLLFPDTYHHYDVHTFQQWGDFHDNMKDLYLTECYCNYPYLGMLLSTGLIRLLGDAVFPFLVVLSFVDMLNILILYRIFRKLGCSKPALWAGIIGLLPAVWVGGALWGQIDTIGQTFLLLLTVVIIQHLRSGEHKAIYFVLYGLLFSACILTKQLLLFPLAPIGVFLLTHLVQSANWMNTLRLVTLGVLFFLLPIAIIDSYVSIPGNYAWSHLEKILLEGSDHMDEISGNGFNIWMLFYDNMGAASTDTLIITSPKKLGLLMFVGLFLFVTIRQIQFLRSDSEWKDRLIVLLFFFVLINLGFNLFLTGTHERYLYHFYPFMGVLIFTGMNRHPSLFSKLDFGLLIFGGILYGAFVFGILQQYHHSKPLFRELIAHRILLVFYLLYFARLSWQYLRFTRKNDQLSQNSIESCEK